MHLLPTLKVTAYIGTDAAYDELWSEPRNLTGSPRHGALESTRLGLVSPEGSNFSLGVPIISRGGRGVGVDLALYYNSRVWGRRSNTVTYDPIASWPSPGFSLGFGRVVTYSNGSSMRYILVDPDGTRHYLGQGTGTYYPISGVTTDGYQIKFDGNINGVAITYPNGGSIYFQKINNRLLPNWIQDTNGNYITITYKDASEQYDENGFFFTYPPNAIDYITDTLGRIIQFNYNSISGVRQLLSITAPAFNGSVTNPLTQEIARFDYESRTISNSFSGLTVQRPASATVLRRVVLPATKTGFVFTYSAYG